ncbi:MAG: hypothetical protein PHV74_07430 [Dehalococcoidia bacterium]|nr:hypothetical protein [Dehalococcoidia bacterium]
MIKICKCGCRIWVEYRWNGLAPMAYYYDEHYKAIDNCPGCGEWLTRDVFDQTQCLAGAW